MVLGLSFGYLALFVDAQPQNERKFVVFREVLAFSGPHRPCTLLQRPQIAAKARMHGMGITCGVSTKFDDFWVVSSVLTDPKVVSWR